MFDNFSDLNPRHSSTVDSSTGVSSRRAMSFRDDEIPKGFPTKQFREQEARYLRWRSWYDGEALHATYTPEGETKPVPLFPIHIQIVRDLCRRRNWVLFGEAPDTPDALIKCVITKKNIKGEEKKMQPIVTAAPQGSMFAPPDPKKDAPTAPKNDSEGKPETKPAEGDSEQKPEAKAAPPQEEKNPVSAKDSEKPAPFSKKPEGEDIDPDAPPKYPDLPTPVRIDSMPLDPDEKLALTCQNIINEVWSQSNGRVLQQENGLTSQYMGGSVFKVAWRPNDEDLTIPIRIYSIKPDFFVPVWASDEMWWLLEAYVIYKISAPEAKYRYGVTIEDHEQATYIEHWTPDSVTITVNGKAVKERMLNGETVYDKVENPFGFVPFVYIPSSRGSDNYGESMVDDVEGLVREFNARFANNGDILKDFADRPRFAFNLPATIHERRLTEDVTVINLGQEQYQHKNPPTVTTDNPPAVPPAVLDFTKEVWKQLIRQSALTDMAFGEDEGTQRSAFGMATKMWSTGANARTQRTYWNEGLNVIAKMILKMLAIKADTPILGELGIEIPEDVLRRVSIAQDFASMLPRDNEQLLNSLVLRKQAGLLSAQTAIEMFGDVRNPHRELQRILDEQRQQTQMMTALQPQPAAGGGDSSEKKAKSDEQKGDAPTSLIKPVANPGLKERN
jgi:hypothetical protein